ncbi:MAG: hypothetical protein HC900_08915 [Methylacidiphilales bacterium]|nr:hypothetical protein [Candidatus Methylacidiphilales bacterium]
MLRPKRRKYVSLIGCGPARMTPPALCDTWPLGTRALWHLLNAAALQRRLMTALLHTRAEAIKRNRARHGALAKWNSPPGHRSA